MQREARRRQGHADRHPRLVAIGGGVGGSALHLLTRLGWSDATPLERSEPTSGSTWPVEGGFRTLNGDTAMLRRALEAIAGLSCELDPPGG